MCFRDTHIEKARCLENTIRTLTVEVNELRVALEGVKSAVHEHDLPALSQQVKALSDNQSSDHNKQGAATTWSEVVKRKRSNKKMPVTNTTALEVTEISEKVAEHQSEPTCSSPNDPRKRTTIPSARGIWGTLKNSTRHCCFNYTQASHFN